MTFVIKTPEAQAGYHAAEANEPFNGNPYQHGTRQYRDWNSGYIQGFSDTRGVKFPTGADEENPNKVLYS